MSQLEPDPTAALRRVVESVRQADFADVDSDLVGEILDIQTRHSEERAEAEKLTEQAVNAWVAKAI